MGERNGRSARNRRGDVHPVAGPDAAGDGARLPLHLGAERSALVGPHVAETTLLGDVGEFVQRTVGPDGLARSIVVVATADDPPLLKRRAMYLATALAEHFRDRGRQVLLMVDSLTRFAEAHRDIAMTAGEPPSARSFPPSTFSQLSHLLERAGPGQDASGVGDISALYTVLV